MKNAFLLLSTALVAAALLSAETDSGAIAKLAAYAGTWKLEVEHLATPSSKASKETSTVRNDCWRSAGFYACNQFVEGESKALIVFTYDAKSDAYHTNVVAPDGSSAGSGKLLITGNTWIYPWEETENGKTTYYRVVNVFTASDTIQYSRESSPDKVTWTASAKGLEKKQN